MAVTLSKKLDIPAVHLDQLQHLPGTDWQPRPEAEFAASMMRRFVASSGLSKATIRA
ncbi:hypothetical protein [Rhizobium leguminosarum]|uniref:hypothetical protein n=1 Tax=Rhizobium leguminosarum TaxID=384 RepID=UPI001FE190ED|nr:hypothetical protein [Rhizobium leguminosarum]